MGRPKWHAAGEIVGLLARKDLIKNQDFPAASKEPPVIFILLEIFCLFLMILLVTFGILLDKWNSSCNFNDLREVSRFEDLNKSLRVAAAVNVLADDRKERVKALINAGVDAIVFDNRRDSFFAVGIHGMFAG